jgi:sialate O-acetylesterase
MHRYLVRRIVMIAFVCMSVGASSGKELRLPHVFSDNMVLQQHLPAKVWGWARAGSTVQVDFAGKKEQVVTTGQGTWELELEPMVGSFSPRALVVTSGDEIVRFQNVLVGEVWVCGGQSNMEFGVRGSYSGDLERLCKGYNGIRTLKLPKQATAEPKEDFEPASDHGRWQVCERDHMP